MKSVPRKRVLVQVGAPIVALHAKNAAAKRRIEAALAAGEKPSPRDFIRVPVKVCTFTDVPKEPTKAKPITHPAMARRPIKRRGVFGSKRGNKKRELDASFREACKLAREALIDPKYLHSHARKRRAADEG